MIAKNKTTTYLVLLFLLGSASLSAMEIEKDNTARHYKLISFIVPYAWDSSNKENQHFTFKLSKPNVPINTLFFTSNGLNLDVFKNGPNIIHRKDQKSSVIQNIIPTYTVDEEDALGFILTFSSFQATRYIVHFEKRRPGLIDCRMPQNYGTKQIINTSILIGMNILL